MKTNLPARAKYSTFILTVFLTFLILGGGIYWYSEYYSVDDTIEQAENKVTSGTREVQEVTSDAFGELENMVALGPDDIVVTVYKEWDRVGGTNRAPEIYEGTVYYTPGFETELKNNVELPSANAIDPLFCHTMEPIDFTVRESDIPAEATEAQVVVEVNFPDNQTQMITVDMEKQNNQWKIADISCPTTASL